MDTKSKVPHTNGTQKSPAIVDKIGVQIRKAGLEDRLKVTQATFETHGPFDVMEQISRQLKKDGFVVDLSSCRQHELQYVDIINPPKNLPSRIEVIITLDLNEIALETPKGYAKVSIEDSKVLGTSEYDFAAERNKKVVPFIESLRKELG